MLSFQVVKSVDSKEIERKISAITWLESDNANGYHFYKGHDQVYVSVNGENFSGDSWIDVVEKIRE